MYKASRSIYIYKMEPCQTCVKPALYKCGGCQQRYYCGKQCAKKDWINLHGTECRFNFIEGNEKRQKGYSLGDYIAENDFKHTQEILRGWRNPENIPVERARTPDMVALCVEHGANVYRYIGKGRVALDELFKYMDARPFMIEASEEMPLRVQEVIEQSKEHLRRHEILKKHPILGKHTGEWIFVATIHFDDPEKDIQSIRHLLFRGFTFERSWFFKEPYDEHILFRRYNSDTLAFWTRFTEHDWITGIERVVFSPMNILKKQAEQYPNPWPLLLFDHTLVYQQSRRAKTNMTWIRELQTNQPVMKEGYQYIPVTRYASGMSHGLFHSSKPDESYCGTFYYHEPESSAFLKYSKALTAKDKKEAMEILQPDLDLDRTYATALGYQKFKEYPDLMLTPAEYVQKMGSAYRDMLTEFEHLQRDREYYCARLLDAYASQDVFDQPLCEKAAEQGYDVVILTEMVGERQVVQEVLDVRSRMESFNNIVFI